MLTCCHRTCLFLKDPFHTYEGNLASLIDEIVQRNWRFRPIYFDFSSSHSINLPYQLIPHGITYKVAVEGDILDEDIWNRYRFRGLLSFLFTGESFEELRGAGVPERVVNTLTILTGQYFLEERAFLSAVEQLLGAEQTQQYKELLLLHAYRRPRIALDPDVRRTFSMYGSARIELGNFYLDMGDVEKASEQFNAAVRLEETLGESIVQMLQFRDKMYGSHVPEAEK
jgi:tetratricopeptide (TPR) repeat protein